ncbi:hypothetical protein M8J76_001994 [Diaphorina citri]|nr:hypothetical protein M8J76_001994 [Diaphorina citri]
MIDALRILAWNANGFTQQNRKRELEVFLHLQKIDIALISETHFTSQSYFHIPNYKTYMTHRPDGKSFGGTAVLVKANIPHHESTHYQTISIQATTVKIESLPFFITVSAVYCPPRHAIQPQDFTALINTFDKPFIAGGDWNAKHTFWGSRLISPRGRALYNATRSGNFKIISTGEPTHWPSDPTRRPDVIDFFVTNGVADSYIHVENRDELSSDHSPIILTLSAQVIAKSQTVKLTTPKTDWEAFKWYIDDKANLRLSLKSPDEVDEAAQYLTKLIQEAANYATPEIKQKEQIINIPKEIRDLIAEKRRVRSRWQANRNPQHKTLLNKLTRKLSMLLHKKQNEAFGNFLMSLSINDNSLWTATKGLKRPVKHVPALKKAPGEYARSSEEKANMFGDHLSSVFQPFPPDANADVDKQAEIEQFLDTPCQMSMPIKPISPADIKFALKNIKKNKAPGYDLITGKILQELPDRGILLMTHIFNAMLRHCYWPNHHLSTGCYEQPALASKRQSPVPRDSSGPQVNLESPHHNQTSTA